MRLIWRSFIVVAITAFWAVMWWALIRSELRPDETNLRSIPPELALRQYFEHEQPSDLFLHEGGAAIGRLRLVPKVIAPGEGYTLQFSGNMQVSAPGSMPQRTAWDGTLTLNKDLHPTLVKGTFSSRYAPGAKQPVVHLEWHADLVAKTASYRYTSDAVVVAEQNFTLDREGFTQVLDQWNLPTAWNEQTAAVSQQAAEVTARMTPFMVRDERVEAILFTVKLGGQTWVEAYLSQLGPVLQVKTLWGWVLQSE